MKIALLGAAEIQNFTLANGVEKVKSMYYGSAT
jgi:hypothetical protein